VVEGYGARRGWRKAETLMPAHFRGVVTVNAKLLHLFALKKYGGFTIADKPKV
jgi:hypothetical protein